MKKIIKKSIFTILLVAGIIFSIDAYQEKEMSDITLTNLKLISTASAEQTSNTGPREAVECGGIFNGKQKMVCKCENEYSCSDSACF